MKYLSLFSGIEAATQAWKPLGWQAVAYSEIEPFPCAVLKHHYQDTPNLGDVMKITESQIKQLGQIDLVVFGSPCQDLSIAGKRKGLDGERSGLFTTAINIINWCRKHGNTRFALWENVPGAFSSNEGKDFAEVIRLLSGARITFDKWQNAGVAIGQQSLLEWRVLDAQYFGVPQRRRRIFALADFGDWTHRQPILFEQKSLPRHIKKSRETRQGTPRLARTLAASGGGRNRVADQENELDFCIPTTMATLQATDATKWGSNQWVDEGKILCLPINDKATRSNGKTGKGSGNGLGIGLNGEPSPTLTAGDKHAVAIPLNTMTMMGRPSDDKNPRMGLGIGEIGQPSNTLTKGHSHAVAHTSENNLMHVRRLTPVECERLQGFPDNFTQIPLGKKTAEQCPDSPRYKALGNSMAVPVMKWIGQRIGTVK